MRANLPAVSRVAAAAATAMVATAARPADRGQQPSATSSAAATLMARRTIEASAARAAAATEQAWRAAANVAASLAVGVAMSAGSRMVARARTTPSFPSFLHNGTVSPIRKMFEAAAHINTERRLLGLPEMPTDTAMVSPDFPPPASFIQAFVQEVSNLTLKDMHELVKFYSHITAGGSYTARELITELLNKKYFPGENVTKDRVLYSRGAVGGTWHSFMSLKNRNENDEKTVVVVFEGYYPTHRYQIERAGHKLVVARREGGESYADALKRVAAENVGKSGKTLVGGVFCSFPGNPLGNKISPDEVAELNSAISGIAKEKGEGLLTIVEHVYNEVDVSDSPQHYFVPTKENGCEYTVTISESKKTGVPAAHIGMTFTSSPELASTMAAFEQRTSGGSSIISESQFRALARLQLQGELEAYYASMREHYEDRRDVLFNQVPVGLKIHPAVDMEGHGVFYLPYVLTDYILGKAIPNIVIHKAQGVEKKCASLIEKVINDRIARKRELREEIKEGDLEPVFKTAHDYASFLLHAEVVAVVPLRDFGVEDHEGFRISAAGDKEGLLRALDGMGIVNQAISIGEREVSLFHKNGKISPLEVDNALSHRERLDVGQGAHNQR